MKIAYEERAYEDPHATAVELFRELDATRRRIRDDTARIEVISRTLARIDAEFAAARTPSTSVNRHSTQPTQSNP